MTRLLRTLPAALLILAAWCAPGWADQARDGTLTDDGGGSATFTGSGTVDLTRASSTSGGYVTFGDHADFAHTTDFTVIIKGNLDDIDGQLLEYLFGATTGGGWLFGVNGTYTGGCSGTGDNVVFLFEQDGDGLRCVGPATTVADDQEVMLSLDVDGSGDAVLCVGIVGGSQTCGTRSAATLTDQGPFEMGRRGDDAWYVDGQIDWLEYHSPAIGTSGIAARFNSGSPAECDGDGYHCWTFNESSGTNAADSFFTTDTTDPVWHSNGTHTAGAQSASGGSGGGEIDVVLQPAGNNCDQLGGDGAQACRTDNIAVAAIRVWYAEDDGDQSCSAEVDRATDSYQDFSSAPLTSTSETLTGLTGGQGYCLESALVDAAGNDSTAGTAEVYAEATEPTSPQVFGYTGSGQTLVVPSGVETMQIDLYGAEGGGAAGSGNYGGYAEGELSVTPGETLTICVGENGGENSGSTGGVGGWNGGADGGDDPGVTNDGGDGGGGATDVRQGGTAGDCTSATYANRVIVAGGGGGDADDNDSGDGGGSTGGAAADSTPGGKGGTQSSGGAAGTGDGNGSAGALGVGGVGGEAAFLAGGGGGGGGFYGGGGGAASETPNSGGGGGGSGYTGGVSNGSMQNGQRAGDGQATITWVVSTPPTFQGAGNASEISVGAGPLPGQVVVQWTHAVDDADDVEYSLCRDDATLTGFGPVCTPWLTEAQTACNADTACEYTVEAGGLGQTYHFAVQARDTAAIPSYTAFDGSDQDSGAAADDPGAPANLAPDASYPGWVGGANSDDSTAKGANVTFTGGGYELPGGGSGRTETVTFCVPDQGDANRTALLSTFWASHTGTEAGSSVTWAWASDCTTPSWSSNFGRATMRQQADVQSAELALRATLTAAAGETARFSRPHVALTPYRSHSTDGGDTFINGAAPTTSYIGSTSQTVGYLAGDEYKYLFKPWNSVIPDGVTGGRLVVYLAPATWASVANLSFYRIAGDADDPGNIWMPTNQQDATDPPTCNSRSPNRSWAWLGSNCADTAGTDFETPAIFDLPLLDGFAAGYYAIPLTLAELQDMISMSGGQNWGVMGQLDYQDPRSATHTLTLRASEHGTTPAYLYLTFDAVAGEIPERSLTSLGGARGIGPQMQFKEVTGDDDAIHVTGISEVGEVNTSNGTDLMFFITRMHEGTYERVVPDVVAGKTSLARTPDGYLHLIGAGAVNVCGVMKHIRSTNVDDPTAWDSAADIDPGARTVQWNKSGVGIDEVTGDLLAALSVHTCDGTDHEDLELWRYPAGGPWEFVATLASTFTPHTLDEGGDDDQNPDYPMLTANDGEYEVCWTWTSNIAVSQYAGSSCIFSLDAGVTWEDAAGDAIGVPRFIYHRDNPFDQPGHSTWSGGMVNGGMVKHPDGDVLATAPAYPGTPGAGAQVVDNTTGGGVAVAFGGGQSAKRVVQTFDESGSDLGYFCPNLRKVGDLAGSLFATVRDGNTTTFDVDSIPFPLMDDPDTDLTATFAQRCWGFFQINGASTFFDLSMQPYEGSVSNAGFETDTSGWATTGTHLGAGASVAQCTDPDCVVAQGSDAARVSVTGSGQGIVTTITSDFLAGAQYLASVYVAGEGAGIGEDVEIVFGAAGDNAVSAPLTLTSGMQKVLVVWTPASNLSAASVAVRAATAFSGDFVADKVAPSSLDNYVEIERQASSGYAGGALYTVNAAGTFSGALPDAVFDLREGEADVRVTEVRRRDATGWHRDADQPVGYYAANLLVSGGGRVWIVGNLGFNGDLYYEESLDKGDTWEDAVQLTTWADGGNRHPWYPGKDLVITANARFLYQTFYGGTGGTFGDGQDVGFKEVRVVPVSPFPWGPINTLGGDLVQ